jgi:hypothetical protein
LNSNASPSHIIFDATPEIFATDTAGKFAFPLLMNGQPLLETGSFDEMRFVMSLWHPSSRRTIDLDRAYVELSGSLDPTEQHWFKLAEIEPVVPPYNAGDTFDGWIVLPVLGTQSAFAIGGNGFQPRARLQIRASAYFVA